MDAANYSYILGSGGNPDYLVVAQNGKACLGVKPYLKPAPGAVFVMVRIRSAAAPAGLSGSDKSYTEAEGVDFSASFPAIEFSQVNSTRSSVVIGMVIKRHPWEFDLIRQDLEKTRFWWKLTEWLGERVDEEQFILPGEEVAEWAKKKFLQDLDEAEAALPKSPGVSADEPIDYATEVNKKMLNGVVGEVQTNESALEKAKAKGITVVHDEPDTMQ